MLLAHQALKSRAISGFIRKPHDALRQNLSDSLDERSTMIVLVMPTAAKYFIVVRAQIFDLQNGAARSANSIVNTVAGVQSAVLTSAGNLANSTGSAVLPLAGTDDVMSQLSETVSRALAGLGNNSPSLVSQSSRFAPSVSSAPTPSQAIVTIPGTDFKSGYAFSG